jgi:cellulose synthase/poly-beta-1,6-N-acetylglucosamine synthase-like glycosyltransferase
MSLLTLVGLLLTAWAALLLIPVCVLFVQILCAWPALRAGALRAGARPRVAVLMPAHDESAGIATGIRGVRAQLQPGDRVLVVADNCSDDTASVARAEGAEVVERRDAERRGKGYALAFGVDALRASPPDVVVIVDADCELHPGSLDRLAHGCAASGGPVQAVNLSRAPPGAGLKSRLLEFASVVKNQARALGFHRLGLPCQLTGTGMAFPWAILRDAPLASGHIVEDLQLGLDLTAAGSPPRLCPHALVTSLFPSDAAGLAAQRTRWEHGHVAVMAQAPRLLARAVTRGQPALAALALDLCVPPLAFLVLGLSATLLATAAYRGLAGGSAPLAVALVAMSLLVASVALAWWRFGRGIVSWREMLTVPLYVLAKVPLYVRALTKRQTEWVRTKRDAADK